MKATEIFKMELFKNLRDRSYLLFAGILTVLAAVVSILFSITTRNVSKQLMGSGRVSDNDGTALGLLSLMLIVVVAGICIFAFLYPLHLFSTDYRNKVMNLMIGSGVKRTNLYFAKMGATVLSSIVLVFFICLIPLITFIVSNDNAVQQFFEAMKMNVEIPLILLLIITLYLSSLVILSFAVILVKGSFVSVLIMYAVQQGCGLISLPFIFLLKQQLMMGNSGQGMLIFSIVCYTLEIIIFGFLGVWRMNKQNF